MIATSAGHPGMLAGFIGFFALTLLTLLDVRRGVLFAKSGRSGGPVDRIRPSRVDWLGAFGVSGWGRPFAQATSFLLNVWHATLLGVLLSGLALTVLQLYLTSYVTRGGFTGSVFGATFALPQPLCSCCSSVMAPSFVRRGASTTFLLSFIIGAPMLNVTTVLLALALLPAPFAITRIGSGLVITVLVTYLVARIARRWEGPNAPRAMGKSLVHDPQRAPLVRRAFEGYATGRYTKEQLLKKARTWGLTNRRGKPLTSQAIGMLLRNQLYAGMVDVPEYSVRGKRGDFEPLISEELFYRVQAILSGRVPCTAPRKRAFLSPLRRFARCESYGRG